MYDGLRLGEQLDRWLGLDQLLCLLLSELLGDEGGVGVGRWYGIGRFLALVIRRLSKKLGEPWRRGIDGERDLLETELLDVEREDLLETLLDDRDELEKLLRLCLELKEERELLLLWLLFSLSRDTLDNDRERLLDFLESDRLLDFFDNERLRDFFDKDLLLDFFERDRLLDPFDNDLVLLLDFSGEWDEDFFERDGDLDKERFDSEEDLDLLNLFDLTGDLGDFLDLDGDVEDLCLGDADFLLLETERDFLSVEMDLECRRGDLEDLFSNDTDLVYDLEGDLE